MIKTIFTAIITYLATSIDEIPILFMLYMNSNNKGKGKTITFSYYIGTFLLIGLGLLGAFGIVQIPSKWVIGLFGLIPIIMGIKVLVAGDDDEDKALEKAKKMNGLWLQVLIITLTMGADDLGVYIPLFSTLNLGETIQMIITFAIGTSILCLISYRLTRIDKLKDFIEEKEKFVVGVVFIAIGLLVIYDCYKNLL